MFLFGTTNPDVVQVNVILSNAVTTGLPGLAKIPVMKTFSNYTNIDG